MLILGSQTSFNMENHPIPQDVTGFQFKLIGNMTVKQFAYLATGVILAVILWQLPVNFLIKFPFCAFSALVGTGLAYFPISGRPMDLMIGNYIKALLRPTQFVYAKDGGQIYFPAKMQMPNSKSVRQYSSNISPFPKDKLKAYLESSGSKQINKVDQRENSHLLSVSNLATSSMPSQPDATPALIIQQLSPQPPIEAVKPAPAKLQQSEPAEPTILTARVKPQIERPSASVAMPAPRALNRSTSALSVPDSPNLVTGITRDARGNALPNILVEIKDKESNPIRAFRTNEFGRFASATPLTNGSYTIEFEDPKAQNKFEIMTVNITGQIVLPVEAISIDAREELRKSLFAANTQSN
jgi:hypothetical protein